MKLMIKESKIEDKIQELKTEQLKQELWLVDELVKLLKKAEYKVAEYHVGRMLTLLKNLIEKDEEEERQKGYVMEFLKDNVKGSANQYEHHYYTLKDIFSRQSIKL